MVALYYILDTVRINATTDLAFTEKKYPKKMDSFDVGWDLAMSLVIPNILRRSKNGLSTSVQRKISTIVTDHQPAQPLDFVVNFP